MVYHLHRSEGGTAAISYLIMGCIDSLYFRTDISGTFLERRGRIEVISLECIKIEDSRN